MTQASTPTRSSGCSLAVYALGIVVFVVIAKQRFLSSLL